MGGITTGVGIFSGIDTGTIIQQLLSIEARPRDFAQARLFALQTQQAAYLDLNSRVSSLRSAASIFRTGKTFQSNKAVSSNETVLTASAGTSAAPGTYSFIVDQLVTSQQALSRGFADLNTSGLGASSFTFETADGRVDRDISLSDLNGGEGVDRGKISVNDGSGAVTVDLSKAATVNDVLDAINTAGLDVTASVQNGNFVIEHNSAGTVTIANADDNETAASLGIVGSGTTITGNTVYSLADATPLSSLNDGNGVRVSHNSNGAGNSVFNFQIDVDGTVVNINLGKVLDADFEVVEGRVTTLGETVDRINQWLEDDLGNDDVQVSINAAGTGLDIVDAVGGRDIEIIDTRGAAADLGLAEGTFQDSLAGENILGGLNTTLLRTLNGGAGVSGDGVINVTANDATSFSVDVSGAETLQEIIDAINDDATNAGAVVASLNDAGNGIIISDTTTGGGSFTVSGSIGNNTADSLGISTDADDTSAGYVNSGSLQHQYISGATRLEDLNSGQGVGTGKFRITDSTGFSSVINITEEHTTIGDVLYQINNSGAAVTARINDNGDGIIIEEDDETNGATAITITDETGSVAKSLKFKGEADGTGDDNYIDGSFETTIDFESTDTLQDIIDAINAAGADVTATVINDGTGGSPYHLSLTSRSSGVDGRFIVDTGEFDLGLETLNEGTDSKVFFGSDDPAKAILLTSSTNTLDGVIAGVTIDLNSTSEDPVELTVSRNTGAIEAKITEFVTSFNDLIDRIDFQTRYDAETEAKGALLGDGTVLGLRNAIFNTVQSEAIGIEGSFSRLTEVGITVGEGGRLEFDTERFREALEEDAAGVEALFAAYDLDDKDDTVTDPDGNELDGVTVVDPNQKDTFSSLGVLGQIEQLAKRYIDSVDGVLTLRNRSLDDQISLQQNRIDAFTERLLAKQGVLEQQFLAMEKAIAGLQAQQGALSALSFAG